MAASFSTASDRTGCVLELSVLLLRLIVFFYAWKLLLICNTLRVPNRHVIFIRYVYFAIELGELNFDQDRSILSAGIKYRATYLIIVSSAVQMWWFHFGHVAVTYCQHSSVWHTAGAAEAGRLEKQRARKKIRLCYLFCHSWLRPLDVPPPRCRLLTGHKLRRRPRDRKRVTHPGSSVKLLACQPWMMMTSELLARTAQ